MALATNSALQFDDFFPFHPELTITRQYLKSYFFLFGCCYVVILLLDSLSPLGLESHKKMSSLSNSTRTASDGLLYCCPCIKMSSLPSTFLVGKRMLLAAVEQRRDTTAAEGYWGFIFLLYTMQLAVHLFYTTSIKNLLLFHLGYNRRRRNG